MAYTLKLNQRVEQFVVRIDGTNTYIVRKHNGSIVQSDDEASVYGTYEGAEALSKQCLYPCSVVKVDVLLTSLPLRTVAKPVSWGRTDLPIKERVRILMAEQLGLDTASVRDDSHVYTDLGADSLDTVELVMAVEDEFGIEISDEEAQACLTLNDIAQFLSTRNIQ